MVRRRDIISHRSGLSNIRRRRHLDLANNIVYEHAQTAKLFSKSIATVSMAPPQRALITVTSAHASLFPASYEKGNCDTHRLAVIFRLTESPGMFLNEGLHPFKVFMEAGFDVDFGSETGTYQPDWQTQTEQFLPDEDRHDWEDPESEFRIKLGAILKPCNVEPDEVLLETALGYRYVIKCF